MYSGIRIIDNRAKNKKVDAMNPRKKDRKYLFICI
jgi:hypothetical protein